MVANRREKGEGDFCERIKGTKKKRERYIAPSPRIFVQN